MTTVLVQPVLHQLRHDPVISLIAFASLTTSVLSDPRSSLCKRDQAWPFLTSKIACAIDSRRLPQDNQYGPRSTRCLYSAPSERAPMVIRRYFHNSPLSLNTSQCISRATQSLLLASPNHPSRGPGLLAFRATSRARARANGKYRRGFIRSREFARSRSSAAEGAYVTTHRGPTSKLQANLPIRARAFPPLPSRVLWSCRAAGRQRGDLGVLFVPHPCVPVVRPHGQGFAVVPPRSCRTRDYEAARASCGISSFL